MKSIFTFFTATLFLVGCAPDNHDHDKKNVRLGTGLMTFDTVPNWGLDNNGKSQIGPTHGGIAIGQDGTVYTSADKGVYAFNPNGKILRSFVDEPFTKLHDIEIRNENGTEYIYGARNANKEGIKFNAQDGEVSFKLPFPKESKLELTSFSPTAITVDKEGNIY
ncbi:6-bladed beta-propeller, partial [Verrucomicrobia bacterium]|nr:6-bladed beta-propeller [Verrucomicrobiota bacterium]